MNFYIEPRNFYVEPYTHVIILHCWLALLLVLITLLQNQIMGRDQLIVAALSNEGHERREMTSNIKDLKHEPWQTLVSQASRSYEEIETRQTSPPPALFTPRVTTV